MKKNKTRYQHLDERGRVARTQSLLSNSQTAELMGVTPHYLDNLRYRGQGPSYVRLSKRRVAYDPVIVEAWISDNTVETGRCCR